MRKTNEPKAQIFLITIIQFKGLDITVQYYLLYFHAFVTSKQGYGVRVRNFETA